MSRKFKGAPLHLQCFNAVRSHRRIYADNKADLLRVDAMMYDNPDEWRGAVSPLIASAAGPRDRAARTRLKQAHLVSKAFDKREAVSDLVLLSKSRFKACVLREDGVDSEAASSDFERLYEEQEGRYNDGKTRRVAMKDNDRIRSTPGEETSREIKSTLQLAGASDAGANDDDDDDKRDTRRPNRRRCRKDRSDDDADDGDGTTRRSRRDGNRTTRRKVMDKLNTDSECDVMHDDLHSERRGTGRSVRSKVALFDGGRRPARNSDNDGLAMDDDEDDFDDDESHRTPRSKSRIVSLSKGADKSDMSGSHKKLTMFEFMKANNELRDYATKTLTLARAKGGTYNKCKQAFAKLTKAQLAQLEKDPKEVTDEIGKRQKALCKAIDRCDEVRLSSFDSYKSETDTALDQLNNSLESARELLQAMKFLVEVNGKKNKAKASGRRYLRDKAQDKLEQQGWGGNMANNFVKKMEKNDMQGIILNSATFVSERPHLWHSGMEKDLCKLRDEVMGIGYKNDSLPDRVAILNKSLESRSDWKGAMVVLPQAGLCQPPSWNTTLGDIVMDGDPGSSPWVFSSRAHRLRYGPHAWPLPGVGAFFGVASEADLDVFVLGLPVQSIMEQGILVKDLPGFLESDSGAAFMENDAVLFPMRHGDLGWVPYGWIPMMVATVNKFTEGGKKDDKKVAEKSDGEDDDDDGKSRASAKDAMVAHMWAWSPLSCSMAASVGAQAWTGITAWNSGYITKNESQRAWADRGRVWAAFLTASAQST